MLKYCACFFLVEKAGPMSTEILPPSPLETFMEMHGNHKILSGRIDERAIRHGYVAAVRIDPSNPGKIVGWENPFGRRRYFATLAPGRIPELELSICDEVRLYATDLGDDTVIPYDLANLTTGRVYFSIYHPSLTRHPCFDLACVVPPGPSLPNNCSPHAAHDGADLPSRPPRGRMAAHRQ